MALVAVVAHTAGMPEPSVPIEGLDVLELLAAMLARHGLLLATARHVVLHVVPVGVAPVALWALVDLLTVGSNYVDPSLIVHWLLDLALFAPVDQVGVALWAAVHEFSALHVLIACATVALDVFVQFWTDGQGSLVTGQRLPLGL